MKISPLKAGLCGLMIALSAAVATITAAQQTHPSQADALADGPRVPGPYGPLSASDANRDGQVTLAEMENFVAMGPERQVGMVAYFDQYDTDADGALTASELAVVDPVYAFDGSDLDADGVVMREEVEAYVSERLYRQMSLLDFFELVDTDDSGIVTESEMIAAQNEGLLPVEDI
ncbi:EF-hand domain-containing protein [Pseudooceanicola sp.]|uniref:EF-hand domain-containing protein n=1 Tax=Pseudooceanicola sp. TaxID=1914328 RepID=UPI003514E514